jgi:hypothetical protein
LEIDLSTFQNAQSITVEVENQNPKIIWPKRPIFVEKIVFTMKYDIRNAFLIKESDLDLNFSEFSSLKTVILELQNVPENLYWPTIPDRLEEV